MKSVYHSAVSALERHHAGLVNLRPEDLAQLERTAAIFDSHYPPRLNPSPALRRPIDRERRRIADSWRIPEGLLEGFKTPKQGALGLGEGVGLSNGANRAVPVQDAKAPVDNFLTATLVHRPGTTRIKVMGKLTARQPRGGQRGRIRELTPQAKARFLELLREIEYQGYRPEHMVTLTLPSDWRGALGSDPALLERLQRALRELNEWRGRMRELRANVRRMGAYPPHYALLEEHYQAVRAEARELIRAVRAMGPNGDRLKAYLKAIIKRFNRRFGTKILASFEEREQAEQHAKKFTGVYPVVTVHKNRKGGFDVVAMLYRVVWWLEFQRRGAPHLHLLFFDVHEIDWTAVRGWIGPAWAGVVHGIRNMAAYQDPALGREYDMLRELWGREVGEAIFAEWLEQRGLDFGVWRHMRAGTRVEKMRKPHWGYAAKEGYGGRRKVYQKRVPKAFQNVGRWWGYRNYKRVKPTEVRIPLTSGDALRTVLGAVERAEQKMPAGAFRYRKKLERARRAIAEGELYAYLTVWGAGAEGAMEALAA
ncbi:hypothetical protein [Oceanithermus sp.]